MTRRFIFAVLGVWVFIFAFETLVHGLGLQSMYRAQDALFRSPEEGVAYLPMLVFGHFLLAAGVVGLIGGFVKSQTIASAGLLGGFLGLTIGAGSVILHFVAQPIPMTLAGMWMVSGLAEMALAAMLARAIFGHPVE